MESKFREKFRLQFCFGSVRREFGGRRGDRSFQEESRSIHREWEWDHRHRSNKGRPALLIRSRHENGNLDLPADLSVTKVLLTTWGRFEKKLFRKRWFRYFQWGDMKLPGYDGSMFWGNSNFFPLNFPLHRDSMRFMAGTVMLVVVRATFILSCQIFQILGSWEISTKIFFTTAEIFLHLLFAFFLLSIRVP